tara:strand:+ start:865 stop:2136 length:1272 start_codon:yes stop_codon:yes gene_type:complete
LQSGENKCTSIYVHEVSKKVIILKLNSLNNFIFLKGNALSAFFINLFNIDKTYRGDFHFPFLDGLRFFAFVWVFLGHLPRPIPYLSFFQKTNWIGVDLFFSLSSFLIMSLFIIEYRKKSTFSIKNFIVRRSLRILPLYYLMICIGFFIYPYYGFSIGPVDGSSYENLMDYLLSFIFMFSNNVLPYSDVSVGAALGPLWSINVEFQFYLFFCLASFGFLYYKEKILKFNALIIISLLLFGFLVRLFFFLWGEQKYIYGNFFTRIDPFIIGCIVSVFCYKLNSGSYDNILNKNLLGPFFLIVTTVLFYFASTLPHPSITSFSNVYLYSITGLGGGCLLISCFLMKNTLAKILSINIFVKLGRLTFGMYVFHSSAIEIAVRVPNPISAMNNNFFCAVLSFLLTVGIAYISYEMYEKAFLKLKLKFN